MYVVIAGGGRTGAQLARMLINQNHEVTVIDSRRDVLGRIHRELPTEAIQEGNLVDTVVLEQAGIEKADVLAACSTSDELNLVLCFIARKRYHVRRTIARVNNPRNAWLFNETFHVDVAVNQAEILARLIEEEMSMGDMMTLLKLRRGNYSLVEEKVPEGSRSIEVEIRDMKLEHCVIAAIVRNGEVIVPRGVSKFEAGDEVLAVADPQGARQLAEFLARPGDKIRLTRDN
jgi:trk system potassium uptake protein TrkA